MKKYLLGFGLIVIVLIGLFGKSTLFRFLSPTERVDTDLLVIEAWTDREGLEQVAAEIDNFSYRRIIVTSLAYPFDSTHAYEVASEGGLTFDLSQSAVTDDSISVSAASVSLHDIPAHFRLWVNDSLVGEAWTKEQLDAYAFALPDSGTIHRVTVEFDNDDFEEGVGDRNLLVQSVRVGGQTFYARMPNVRYDRGRIDGQKLRRTDARSEADETANFLRRQGVPDSMLISVAAPVTDYNKTYASARAAQEWLARWSEPMPLSLNVFSEGAHARRSRLLYRKAFGSSVRIGVIAVPKEHIRADNWWESRRGAFYLLEQVAKYLYARLFFWPDEP